MSHRLPLRTFLSACLVASVVTPVAAQSTSTPTSLARTALATARTHGEGVPRTPTMHSPDRARMARLRAAVGHLPLSFEHAAGQANRGDAYAARGAGYVLYVTAKGATLVLAAPHVVSRAQPHLTAARLPLLTGHSHPSRQIATLPPTPTATGAASAIGTGVALTATVIGTAAATAPATAPAQTGAGSVSTATLPVPTATITPSSTRPVPSTATLTPTTLGTATAAAPADTATPVAHGRHARPTVPAGAGTVTPAPIAPPSIVRHGPGITQTTVLTPTGLAAAMALHLQRHGHAHGKGQRHPNANPAPPAVVQLAFVGANPEPRVVGLDPLTGTANYLLGAARQGWRTRVPTYGRVAYRALYPGIDLAFHGSQGTLEYDWLLAPHAVAGRIRLAVRGAGQLRLDRRGDLLLQTAAGTLRQARPVAYQQSGGQRRPVTARYILLTDREVGLAVGAYDQSRPLVIDPVLSYATYLGGSDVDQGTGIAVDGSGYVYVTGDTFSSNFPTVNPEQGTFAGGTQYGDAFITKLTPDGSSIVYSTYLGGSADEDVWKIAVDNAGEAIVAGYTASTDFPLANAAQATYGGGPYDGFVSKLSADGSSLVYSTYLGGSGDDEGYGVALDGAGNAYVTGLTSSPDFPTTANAAQGSFGGYYDAFVTELSPSGSLVYSTYLGGTGDDDGYAIAVDAAGNAYVAGATTSADFTVSTNAAQPYFTGGCAKNSCAYDAFVAKIAAGGASIAYGTYLGGSGDDQAEGLAVDGNGNAWVTGYTASADFPVANAAQATYGGGAYDAFVAELTPDGSALPYSSYLGGSGNDEAYALALDSAGDVYVAGETASPDFPVVNAAQATYGGGPYDAFVAEVSAAGGSLVSATYLGGTGDDAAFGVAVGPDGSVAVAGLTSSTDFPTTNAVQSTYNSGSYDAFVAGYAASAAGATCPDGWSCDDIGAPPLAGDQTLTTGTWTIRGSGGDIWNNADQFHFVSQQVSGDSSIVARLTSQQNTSVCTKAGIMYRASTDAGDVNYSVVMLPDCHYATSSVQMNYRDTSGAYSTTANDVPFNLPIYLKATRTGSTFTASTSTDGATWTPIANSSVSLPNMPANALVGLVVCSQNNTTTSQATFDNVSLTGATDLSNLDMESGHYTQTVNSPSSPVDLHLYNSPAGVPDVNGWQPISLTLGMSAASGMLTPPNAPFNLQIAPTSAGPTLASLVSEDGVAMGVGLAPASASPAATPVAGQVNLNAVTYPSLAFPVVAPTTATPPVADLSLRAIPSGLDVRVVLRNAQSSGPFTLALAPDPGTNAQLTQDPNGVIRVMRPITQYGDDGSPVAISQTEYLVRQPAATDSSADPAAPANTGPVTSSLVSTAGITQYVTLSVDPMWLNDPRRAFPVAVDLPIATSDAALRSGAFGTVNSCNPITVAPPTDLVVGTENGCTYKGQAYFDLSSVSSDNTVVSATLHLYTPNQTGATGVQVYQNATGDADPSQPVSWNTAPPVMTGTTPLAQSASDGRWQSWDVTSIVQQWVQDGSANAGLALAGSGAPVRFASALGTGTTDPSLTPYLDISYAPSASSTSGATTNAVTANATTAATPAPGPYNDKSQVIYGDSGSYTADDPTLAGNGSAPIADAGSSTVKPPCTSNGVTCGPGDFRISASRFQFRSQFVRFGVELPCTDFQQKYGISPTAPGARWWGSDDQRPISHTNNNINNPVDATHFNIGDVAQLVTSARAWGSTPVININAGDYCSYENPTGNTPITRLSPQQWYAAVQDLVTYLNNSVPTFYADKSKPVYFEVGNEPNLQKNGDLLSGNVGKYTDGTAFTSADGTYHYEDIFAYAARGLNQALSQDGYNNYRILTAGMFAPTAATSAQQCQAQRLRNPDGSTFTIDSYDTVFAAGQGINEARFPPPGFIGPGPYPGPVVPNAHLGVAVHPYGDDTQEKNLANPRYWKNYYHNKLGGYAGPCQNLSLLISTWEA